MVRPDIPCVDIWPPGTCGQNTMLAYKSLEEQGQILIRAVEISEKTDSVCIRYMANMPHEWMLETLKREKQRLAKEV